MPAITFVTPTGTVDPDEGYSVSPNNGTTIRASWTATGLVTFTGHFRNRNTNALIGPQTFTNNSSGNWLFTADPGFNGTTPYCFEMDTITNNGKNITVTLSVDSGPNWSGNWLRRSGVWTWAAVFVRRSSTWVFTWLKIRRTGAWVYIHR